MKNTAFYLITVLIWGSTWIGIKLQLGVVDPVASVTYRFALASLLLLLWTALRGVPMRFSLAEHGCFALQGLLLFSTNYLLFYLAELHVTSGLAAVLFSTIVLLNTLNGALLLGTPVNARVLAGGLLGLAGLAMVFRQEITAFSLADDSLVGILLCLAATMLASWGNIVSARNQRAGLPIVPTNAYGMGYGAIAMLIIGLARGTQFTVELTPVYLGSLLYLALFGSIIAFGCYLALLGSIGASRAAYATLLFPIVALAISTVWENYQWTTTSLTGVGLILLGNLWVMHRRGAGARTHLLRLPHRRLAKGQFKSS